MAQSIEPFWGDENPQDFLRAFCRTEKNEETRPRQFGYYLAAGSPADEWWIALPRATKATWALIEEAFEVQWPPQVTVSKSRRKYEEELLALRLKDEELGTRIASGKRETHAHIAWADKMATLAKGAKVYDSDVLIGEVVKNLPRALRMIVRGEYASWAAFLTAVKEVDVEELLDLAEEDRKMESMRKELTSRIRHLEAQPPSSPTSAIRQRMAATTISPTTTVPVTPSPLPSNPFMASGGGRGNLFNTPSTPSRRRAPPVVTPALQAAVRASLAVLPHHPPTDAGYAAHAAQQLAWASQHGATAWIDEKTPYPLRPGTSPVASGECFRCGMVGHRGAECTVPQEKQLHSNEQKWRVFCANVLRDRAVGVQLVSVSDYGHTAEVEYVGVGDYGSGNEGGASAEGL